MDDTWVFSVLFFQLFSRFENFRNKNWDIRGPHLGQSSEHFPGSWASRMHAGLGSLVSVTCSPPPTQPSLEPVGRKGGDGALALPGPGWALPHLHHLLQDRDSWGPGLHLCKLSPGRRQDSLKVTQQGRGGSQVCLLSQALSLCGWVGFVSTPTLPATFVCLLALLAFLSHPKSLPCNLSYDLPILGNTPASGAPIPLPPFLGVTFPRSHSWRWPSTVRVWVCSVRF